jgi:hypothetical protein
MAFAEDREKRKKCKFAMKRAVKVTLQFAEESKRRKIAALVEANRAAVNLFISPLLCQRF